MATGAAPELTEKSSFVGRWMDILEPGYERIKDAYSGQDCVDHLEKEAVKVSLDNLMTFPFVSEAVKSEELSLHGLWHDIGEGGLMYYDAGADTFQPV
jgi:carbonic anhydrase